MTVVVDGQVSESITKLLIDANIFHLLAFNDVLDKGKVTLHADPSGGM